MKIGDDPVGKLFLGLHGMGFALHGFDLGELCIREQFVVSPHHLVRDAHDFAVHFKGRLVNSDGVAERL